MKNTTELLEELRILEETESDDLQKVAEIYHGWSEAISELFDGRLISPVTPLGANVLQGELQNAIKSRNWILELRTVPYRAEDPDFEWYRGLSTATIKRRTLTYEETLACERANYETDAILLAYIEAIRSQKK